MNTNNLLFRPQPRWLVWLIGIVALAVIVRIILVADQIRDLINQVYATYLV
jgi:hypothetical protein